MPRFIVLFAASLTFWLAPGNAYAQTASGDAAYTDSPAPAVLYLNAVEMQTPQEFMIGTPLTFRWDPPTNEAAAQTSRYETRFDSDASYLNPGVTIPAASYAWLMPQSRLTAGDHTVYVRACSTRGCGPELSVEFRMVLPLPGVPRNPSITPSSPAAVITVPRAFELANAYAQWWLDRSLTTGEMGWLAARHPNTPPTKYTVLAVLDEAAASPPSTSGLVLWSR